MKNVIALLLLLFCAAGIVASGIVIVNGGQFMIVHLVGSFVLLSFVFLSGAFKTEKVIWGTWQKTFSALSLIYIAFLVITLVAVTYFSIRYSENFKKEGKAILIPPIAVALYIGLSIAYYRNAKKAKGK
ncbi:MAG: hypothetical protein M3R17_07650 [Bacteroidota bacterium]|nr:hypothetical protein [Bacteroidota bacterium]